MVVRIKLTTEESEWSDVIIPPLLNVIAATTVNAFISIHSR
jgi:hypothetical protein